jgi:hypothetical protein
VTSVSQLAAELGPTLLVSARGNLGAEVSSVVVTDPVNAVAAAPGALVVAVGHPLAAAPDLQKEALSSGASAVLVKGSGEPQVDDDGPAVLVVDPAADWGHVISLARVAVKAIPAFDEPGDRSLFSLADALASLCGGSVVVHDAGWQLLAHSGGEVSDQVRSETLVDRRAPAALLVKLREHGVVDRLMHGELIHLQDDEVPGLPERYTAAVLINGQLFGTIWVTPAATTNPEQALDGLRRSVEVAALALLRHATLGAGPTPEQDVPFAALLGGAHTERLVAQRLGVAVDHGFVLAGIRPTTTDPTERAATARRLLGLARSYGEAYRVTALAAASGDTCFLLFPSHDDAARRAALRVLTDLHSRLTRSAPHRAMVSGRFALITDITAMRSVVEELLDLSERRGWHGLTDTEAVQATWRLEQFREVALAHPALLVGPGMRLLEHDRQHGGELLSTLRAYFAAVGDVKVAAAGLGLHYNTVRYRLRKAAEVAGLDLNDPDQRLLAELQVRLLSE